MRNLFVAVTILLFSPAVFGVPGHGAHDKKPSEQEKEKSSRWMKRKLEHAQNILAGLTKADFDLIADNAKSMQFLGYLEKWERADQPAYKRQVVYFEMANQEVIRQAGEKNLAGVTLAYNQLTVSCVQCHKVVRDLQK